MGRRVPGVGTGGVHWQEVLNMSIGEQKLSVAVVII